MKLTKWHLGHIKPVRKGVYQQMSGLRPVIGYQYWDGNQWMGWCETIGGAHNMRADRPASPEYQNDKWRGIAK